MSKKQVKTVPQLIEIAKTFRFEAAHFLPQVNPEHQCSGIHGHSYIVTLRLKGPLDEKMGWVMDLSDLSLQFEPWRKTLDHTFLNNIDGLENPTSENLALWIMRHFGKEQKLLNSVTIESTTRLSVTVYRQDMDF